MHDDICSSSGSAYEAGLMHAAVAAAVRLRQRGGERQTGHCAGGRDAGAPSDHAVGEAVVTAKAAAKWW